MWLEHSVLLSGKLDTTPLREALSHRKALCLVGVEAWGVDVGAWGVDE